MNRLEEPLELLVVMQNAGLPEEGDVAFPFPDDFQGEAYPAAAAAGDLAAAERRRDLAVSGFAQFLATWRAHALLNIAPGKIANGRVTPFVLAGLGGLSVVSTEGSRVPPDGRICVGMADGPVGPGRRNTAPGSRCGQIA